MKVQASSFGLGAVARVGKERAANENGAGTASGWHVNLRVTRSRGRRLARRLHSIAWRSTTPASSPLRRPAAKRLQPARLQRNLSALPPFTQMTKLGCAVGVSCCIAIRQRAAASQQMRNFASRCAATKRIPHTAPSDLGPKTDRRRIGRFGSRWRRPERPSLLSQLHRKRKFFTMVTPSSAFFSPPLCLRSAHVRDYCATRGGPSSTWYDAVPGLCSRSLRSCSEP